MKTAISRSLGFALATAAFLFGPIAPAQAAMKISMDDGSGSPVIVQDQMAGDINPTVGVIVFSGSVGAFSVQITTGVSKPVIGSATRPDMDLASVTVGGAGKLTLRLTDTDFDRTGDVPFGFGIGGTTDGAVDASAFVDDANPEFGTDTTIASFSGLGAGRPFSAQGGSTASLTSPFSMTILATITHAGTQDITSFDAELEEVPEPASLALFGMGLLGLGFACRRRARQTA